MSRGSGGRLRTRSSAIAAMATSASGTCTTKIARQSKSCVSTPPSAGPAAAPIVPASVQTAAPRAGVPANAARPRSDAASNSAPPRPCRQRKPMRTSRLQAAAQPAEPAAKRPMPTIPVGRGRRRRAKGTRQRAATATTRLYDVITQETPTSVVSNSPYRSGSARTTIEESAKATATPAASAIVRTRVRRSAIGLLHQPLGDGPEAELL